MKIFKNKFFIVALSIAIIITILCSVLSIIGSGNVVKDAANVPMTPFRYIALKIGEGFSGFGRYFTSIDKLYEENSSLRDEIDDLEAELEKYKGASEENERFREYLNIIETHPNLSMLEALVTGRYLFHYFGTDHLSCIVYGNYYCHISCAITSVCWNRQMTGLATIQSV